MSPDEKSEDELREELQELKEKPNEATSEKKLKTIFLAITLIISILFSIRIFLNTEIWLFLYFSIVAGTIWIGYTIREKKYLIAVLVIGIFIPIGIHFYIHSPGTITKTIPSPGEEPTGMAWDGNNLCVADQNGIIYKVNPTDGKVKEKITTDIEGRQGGLVWIDGIFFYGNSDPDNVFVIDAKTGVIKESFETPGVYSMGLAWGGGYLWNLDYETTEIYQIDIDSKEPVLSFGFPGTDHSGLTWMGGSVWSSDISIGRIYKLDSKNGQPQHTLEIDRIKNNRGGLTSNGNHLWFSTQNALLKISAKHWYENIIETLSPLILILACVLGILQPLFAYPAAKGVRKILKNRVESRKDRIQEIESEIHQDRFKKQRSRENLREIEKKVKKASREDLGDEFPEIMEEGEELLEKVKDAHKNRHYNDVLDLYSDNQKLLRDLVARTEEMKTLNTTEKVEEVKEKVKEAKEINVGELYPELIEEAEKFREDIQKALEKDNYDEIDRLYSRNKKLLRKVRMRIEEVREMGE